MYWVSFALITLFDNYTYFVLSFIPLYSTLRLFVLLYLVLPQTQGARLLYQSHIHPFLAHHEARIDRLISDTHDRIRTIGLNSLHDLIAYIKRTFLGIQDEAPPRQPSAAAAVAAESYAQSLLARFNLPSAREGLAAPASDFYGLLSAAVGSLGRGAGATSAAARDAQIEELGRSGMLIPQHIKGTSDRARFVGQQREKLRVLLGALDREAGELEIQGDVEKRLFGLGGESLVKSKSEAGFERIDKEEAGDSSRGKERDNGAGAGGWLGWAWGSGEGKERVKGKSGKEEDKARGTSSSVDRGT